MIVTVTAYKRPELLEWCLESIEKACVSEVSKIIVSLDYHSPQMTELMCNVMHGKGRNLTVVLRPSRLGVANHPRALFNEIMDETEAIVGPDYIWRTKEPICALEEDTIVSPDCFLFAAWALLQPGYQFVNLARPLGQPWPENNRHDQERVHADWELRSPYGWAFTPTFWHQLEPQWNGKIRLPYGWDWQLSHLCYREGWRCLTPEVARVYNTGRENGTYDTPSNWDATQKDVVICSTVHNKYVVVEHERPPLSQWPEWVKVEMTA